jgi:hypothetical protein
MKLALILFRNNFTRSFASGVNQGASSSTKTDVLKNVVGNLY